MADYQEYRRRVLHRRWRRAFITVALLALLVLAAAVAVLWKSIRPSVREEQIDRRTVLEMTIPGGEWSTLNYTRQRSIEVASLTDGTTAMDFRLASQPQTSTDGVDISWFDTAAFVGDSLTQGLQIYDAGLPNASYCAYVGIGPNAIVNGSTCTRLDGEEEVPLEALTAAQPEKVYILLGTNVLTQDTSYDSFLAYYGVMLDMIRSALPDAVLYIQSITPVRPELSEEENHAGMYQARFIEVNDELAALAVEKNCVFLDLWEVLADENGDLREEYAQADGYHLTDSGYAAWVEYLQKHTVYRTAVEQADAD